MFQVCWRDESLLLILLVDSLRIYAEKVFFNGFFITLLQLRVKLFDSLWLQILFVGIPMSIPHFLLEMLREIQSKHRISRSMPTVH